MLSTSLTNKRKHRSKWARVSLVVAGGIVLAACGSGSAPTTTAATKATTVTPYTVNVGVLPIADVAPLYLGIQQGFFAKQKLTVVPHALQGGAAVASAVVGGSLDFGFGATANLILAKAQHLPLQFVAEGDQAGSSPSTAWSGIMVAKGSAITSIADLAGKTIAANALQGENELALDAILLRNGVNPSSVHVVALPFPSMPSALAAGQVQAVTEVEPFVSAIKAQGGTEISPLFEGMAKSMTVAGYFTTTSEISSNPSLVRRFVTAMNESLSYAASHASAVRQILPTYTSIPASVASKMTLPIWSSSLSSSSISAQEKTMKTLGWIHSLIPVSQLVWSGA